MFFDQIPLVAVGLPDASGNAGLDVNLNRDNFGCVVSNDEL